jgi:hypothetical protein
VLRAEGPFPCVKYSSLEISGRGITTARSEVIGDSGHPCAVIGESLLGVRQQRRAYRRGPGRGGIARDRGLDQGGSSLLPVPGQLGRHLIFGDALDQPVHRYRPVPGRADQRIAAQRRCQTTGDRSPIRVHFRWPARRSPMAPDRRVGARSPEPVDHPLWDCRTGAADNRSPRSVDALGWSRTSLVAANEDVHPGRWRCIKQPVA